MKKHSTSAGAAITLGFALSIGTGGALAAGGSDTTADGFHCYAFFADFPDDPDKFAQAMVNADNEDEVIDKTQEFIEKYVGDEGATLEFLIGNVFGFCEAPQGEQGEQGKLGDPGEQGAQGPQGKQGPPGTPGATGATGDTGSQGPQGKMGLQGEQGPQGKVGPVGDTGPATLHEFRTRTIIFECDPDDPLNLLGEECIFSVPCFDPGDPEDIAKDWILVGGGYEVEESSNLEVLGSFPNGEFNWSVRVRQPFLSPFLTDVAVSVRCVNLDP